MLNNICAHTTIYNIPLLPFTKNLLLIGDNKRIHAEVVTDFIASFYKLLRKTQIIVYNKDNLFKNIYNLNNIVQIQENKIINVFLQKLIKHKSDKQILFIALNTETLEQDLILKLLKTNKNNLQTIFAYTKPVKDLNKIINYTQQAIFFKTKQPQFLNLYKNFCNKTDLKKSKGFVNLDFQKQKCEYYRANLGLKTHLLYNELTEILSVMFKKFSKKEA